MIRRCGTCALLLGLMFVGEWARAGVEVEILGVEDEALENIRAFLQIIDLVEDDADDSAAPARVRRLHRRAPEQIREALRPLGYFDPSIESSLDGGPEDWIARYTVDPGEPARMRAVDVELIGAGKDDRAFRQRLEELGLAVGDRAHHGRYEEAKRELMTLATQRGYVEARWRENRLEVNPATRQARAILHLDTGPRYRFGEVTFEQDVLRQRFLRRYLTFEPGDPFDRRKLLDLQFALQDSEYFDAVDVSARRDRISERAIPVQVELEPRARDRYTWGIGFGTDTGVRTRASWERRRLNRRGHRLSAQVELAQIRSRFGMAYTIPLADPTRERFVLSADFREEEFGDGEAESTELRARRVRMWSGWQFTESILFESSRNEIGDRTDNQEILVPGVTLERRQVDDALYPRQGYRFLVETRAASRELGSDVGFAQVRVAGNWIQGLWPGTRLLTRAEWGGTKVDETDSLPLSQRFFTGGDTTVRGFDFQQLGPTNDDGEAIGGRFLTTASVEFEALIVGNWGAAVFTDVGNVSADRRIQLEQSVGVGLRWRSPVGMLRVDVAKPVSTDGSPRLHLSLGINL